MATAEDIGWGSYRQYEGPYYKGKHPAVLPEKPNAKDKILHVITATEGGRYDAFNGYDVCGWTSGAIQWCERGQYSVSDMLGKVAAFCPNTQMQSLYGKASHAGYGFSRTHDARGRYRFNQDANNIDTLAEQQQLFYLGGDGTKGSWTPESKQNALEWAAAISTVWEFPAAQAAQRVYTSRRLYQFAYKTSRAVVNAAPDTPYGQAFVAAYLSFAANNPKRANDHLEIALSSTSAPEFGRDWLIHVLKELTFGPGVAIYPHRYESIRPVLEELYGVDLPDLKGELKAWLTKHSLARAISTAELQGGLINLNYDLGPAGADGKFGKKTKEAVISFETAAGLAIVDGYPDARMLLAFEAELERIGAEQIR